MNIIETKNIEKTYKTGDEVVEALKDVNLTLTEGEILAIMGSSGSGKSTLLHILGGLERPDDGEVYLNESTNPVIFKEPQITEYREKNIGFIFQRFNLIGDLTVRDNIEIPLHIKKEKFETINEKVEKMARMLGISSKLDNKPGKLSGGQQQRVASARALIGNPRILLADEPTGALDVVTTAEILDILTDLNRELNQSIIVVTHDAKVASCANRVVFLHNGQIKEEYRVEADANNVANILDLLKTLEQ